MAIRSVHYLRGQIWRWILNDLNIMTQIMDQKAKEIHESVPKELDDEGTAMADTKCFTIDYPANAVKTDPLR